MGSRDLPPSREHATLSGIGAPCLADAGERRAPELITVAVVILVAAIHGTARVVSAAVLACLAVGCAEDDVHPVGPTLPFTLVPQRVAVAPGDTVALTVRGDSPAAARAQVRWRSPRPDIVRLDTMVAAGRPVYARAVAPGDVMLEAVLTYEATTVTTAVPVTVR